MPRRRCILGAGLFLVGCFADSPTMHDTAAEASTGDPSATSAAVTATGVEAGSMSGGVTTQPFDDGTTTTMADTGSSSGSESTAAESSTGSTEEPFCAAQPPEVVLCYDFDGADPWPGAAPLQEHGTLDVTDERFTSEPQSMEVVAIGDPVEITTVAIGRWLAGVPTPFAGELSAMVWLHPECFPGGLQERLVMALQFWEDGVFFLNFTIWVTNIGATLYASDESQGFPSQAYPLGLSFVADEWVRVAIAFDATDDLATVTLGDESEVVNVDIITPTITGEIVGIAPAISIGTAMQPGDGGCTMWFDDVTVTLD